LLSRICDLNNGNFWFVQKYVCRYMRAYVHTHMYNTYVYAEKVLLFDLWLHKVLETFDSSSKYAYVQKVLLRNLWLKYRKLLIRLVNMLRRKLRYLICHLVTRYTLI
jgi:hypothetical protein